MGTRSLMAQYCCAVYKWLQFSQISFHYFNFYSYTVEPATHTVAHSDITTRCSHNLPTKVISKFDCLNVPTQDVEEFRRKLFESDDKIKQDCHVLLNITVESGHSR